MPMNPEIKAKWVEALRSDKFAQGNTWLVRDGSKGKEFCCLGVLCEIAGLEKNYKVGAEGYSFPDGSHHTSLLSDTFREKMGISKMEQRFLTKVNDDGITFKEIAAIIESDL